MSETPLIGRNKQLTQLTQLAQSTMTEKRLKVVLVEGEPGVGKTALVREFVKGLEGSGWGALWGSCAQDGSSPYGPVREATGCKADAVLPDRDEMLRELVGILAEKCRARPTILVIDDLQWADDWSYHFIEFLANNRLEIDCLICATVRDSSQRNIEGVRSILHQRGDLISLTGVTAEHVSEIYQSVTGRNLADKNSAALQEFTGGNPLCVVHFARSTSDIGEINRWQEVGDFPLPQKIREVLMSRYRGLPRTERSSLEILAELRNAISFVIIAAVSRDEDLRLSNTIGRLVEEGFVRLDGGKYAISHGLLRQVIRAEMAADRRSILNRRIADALRAEDESQIEEIAFHYDRSDDHLNAFAFLWEWSKALREMGAFRALDSILQKALGHLESAGSSQFDQRAMAEFHLDLAFAALRLGDRERYERILSSCECYPKTWYRFYVESLGCFENREFAKALPLLTNALSMCSTPRDRALVVREMGLVYEGLGQPMEAAQQIDLVAEAYEELKDARLENRIRGYRGYAAFLRQDYGKASMISSNTYGSLTVTIRASFYHGDFVMCEKACRSSLSWSASFGGADERARLFYSRLLEVAGDTERSMSEWVKTIEQTTSEGVKQRVRDRAWTLSHGIEMHCRRREADRASELVCELRKIDLSGETETVRDRAMGLYHLALGDLDEARKWLSKAVSFLRDRRGGEWMISLIEYCEFLVEYGPHSEAVEHLKLAQDEARRMGFGLYKDRLTAVGTKLEETRRTRPGKPLARIDEFIDRAQDPNLSPDAVVDLLLSVDEVRNAWIVDGDGLPLAGAVPESIGEEEAQIVLPLDGLGRIGVSFNKDLPEKGTMRTILSISRLLLQGQTIQHRTIPAAVTDEDWIGVSHASESVRSRIAQAAGCDESVLIVGETGTGKDLVAEMIHKQSARSDQPFQAVNCANLSGEILLSELFGHAKGAFTGALRDHVGLVESANGGTLFLDEVGEAGSHVQASLLRVLQNGQIRRVGETRTREVNVRVLSATNADLGAAIEAGAFRADLFYRLNTIELTIPALRDRPEDVRPLALDMIARLAPEGVSVSESVIDRLSSLSWPGNVRELENIIRRLSLAAGDSQTIDDRHLGQVLEEGGGPPSLNEMVAGVERRAIQDALAATDGNVSGAARRLGMSRGGLQKKMTKYDIQAA